MLTGLDGMCTYLLAQSLLHTKTQPPQILPVVFGLHDPLFITQCSLFQIQKLLNMQCTTSYPSLHFCFHDLQKAFAAFLIMCIGCMNIAACSVLNVQSIATVASKCLNAL